MTSPKYEVVCAIAGCTKRVSCRGLCNVHYQRLLCSGGLDAYPTTVHDFHECSVEGCEVVAHAKGLCKRHYAKQYAGTMRDPSLPPLPLPWRLQAYIDDRRRRGIDPRGVAMFGEVLEELDLERSAA